MPSRHHYRRRSKELHDLDMTTFLNLMVVLVPFLLITAVFSRITIIELNLPSSTSGGASSEPSLRVEVIVRAEGIELRDGKSVVAVIPNVDDEYDLATLSEHALSLKRNHPDATTASVLLEPEIEYDHLIQVMDAVRTTSYPREQAEEDSGEEQQVTRVALFTDISIGDAP
jgi:biopolymer transport protein ExbD